MTETHKRSILKTIAYRILSFAVTSIIVFIVTRQIGLSLSIGLFDTGSKLIVYYLHERAWNSINFGRRDIEYEI